MLRGRAADVGHIVEVAGGIGRFEVDGRGNPGVLDGQAADGRLDGSARAQGMAVHRLRGAEDRFGEPPRPVWDALAVLRLRLRCKALGIASIKGERTDVAIRFAPHVRLTPDAIKLLTFAFKNYRFTPDGVIVSLTGPKILVRVEEMVATLERALEQGKNGKKAGNGSNAGRPARPTTGARR